MCPDGLFLTLGVGERCRHMRHGRAVSRNRGGSRERIVDPGCAFWGRAARRSGGERKRAGVRNAVCALPPAPVPLLPVDRARRRRCPGRAAVHADERVCGAEAGPTRRAAASVVVSDRTQRGDLPDPPAARPSAQRGPRAVRSLCRAARRRAGTPRFAGRRLARVARPSARRAGDARVKRAVARGDRARAGNLGGCGETKRLRGSPLTVGVRGGAGHGV